MMYIVLNMKIQKLKLQKLGDERNIVFAIGTMIISMIGIVILAIKKFKNRKNK